MDQTILKMLEGAQSTLAIFFLTIVFSLPLGMIFCMGRMSKNIIIRNIVKLYLLLMRGTPLMLQLLVVFFAVPNLIRMITGSGFIMDRFVACIVAFVLNYAAYFAEIYRGGLESIPQGQYEAAKVLGFSKNQTFFRVILPQVIKRIMPPMGNELITLVKDTSLATIISVTELMFITKGFVSGDVSFVPYIIAAIFYLVMNGILTFGLSRVEKRLSYYR